MAHEIIWEGDTLYGHFQIADTLYDGRPARVLYGGKQRTAQSGVAKDDNPDLLFDYNQRLFELVTNLSPKELLLIGGAVETLPVALLRALPEVQIDVVEPDSGLTDLGYEFFDLQVDDRLHIVHTDGRNFLQGSSKIYDVILMDAFVQDIIPRDLRSTEAFRMFAEHLLTGGVLAMNVISSYYGKGSAVLRGLCAAAMESFGTTELFLAGRGYSLWLPQNFILTAHSAQNFSLRDYVRHEAIQLPDVRSDEAVRDSGQN